MDFIGSISGFFGGFDFASILGKIKFYGMIFILILLLGVIIGGIWYFKKKKKPAGDLKKIAWWEETTSGPVPVRSDEAEEIIIPGTTLRVFYVKDRDLWLPRFTKGITKDLFYVMITPNRQMVNFTLKSLGASLKEAGLDYDHTDMLFAAENMREFIKRNYKDKAIKWWQAYQGIIAIAIFIFLMTVSLAVILYMMGKLSDKIGLLIDHADQLVKAASTTAASGIRPA